MERDGSKKCLVLYHFVTCLGSSSAEPGIIFRRFLKKVLIHLQEVTEVKLECIVTMVQIKYVCGETTPLPTIPSNLMECFTDYLEKLSVTRVEEEEIAVIVIDGADLMKVITYIQNSRSTFSVITC